MRVLVLNAGSSSLKVSLVDADDGDRVLADRELEVAEGHLDAAQLANAVRGMEGIEAVGHRIVHGGPRYRASVRIDGDVMSYLVSITDLAPLHLPSALAGVSAARELLPRIPAVACLDTAFHSRMPEAASTYAVPAEWRSRFGIKRYGFHGFSHAYASRRAAEMLGRSQHELRVVTCHLGAGASLAAVRGGRSVDTTMGFTPLEGLVMATRSGTVDPGALLYLQRHTGATEPELTDALDRDTFVERDAKRSPGLDDQRDRAAGRLSRRRQGSGNDDQRECRESGGSFHRVRSPWCRSLARRPAELARRRASSRIVPGS